MDRQWWVGILNLLSMSLDGVSSNAMSRLALARIHRRQVILYIVGV